MKTLIVSINSQYIHSSLAPWYLKESLDNNNWDVSVLETTINDDKDRILSSIYKKKADIIAFSCYIWNVDVILMIAENLKKILPRSVIILGGPEVSYDAEEILQLRFFIDCVIMGEGELLFKKAVEYYSGLNNDFEHEIGIAFRKSDNNVNNSIIVNHGYAKINDSSLDIIKSPYSKEMLSSLKGRIVYYESSRGCPFSCSYCLSSSYKGVRYFSIPRVKSDLVKLINAGVKQIKFVDRTFNANRKRVLDIIDFILQYHGSASFHFEVAGDLFSEDILKKLAIVPAGMIQFEIGAQSTNIQTLEESKRQTDITRVLKNAEILIGYGNIHIHMDLIAGLPFETLSIFRKSFNDVYSVRPHMLQLGFLKFLKGTVIRSSQSVQSHKYEYRETPPYEFLSNKYLSYDDTIHLKSIEEILDRYYNSGNFQSTLEFLITNYFETPYDFYSNFSDYLSNNNIVLARKDLGFLHEIILNYSGILNAVELQETSVVKVTNETLKFDYFSSNNSKSIPKCLVRHTQKGFTAICFEFLKNEEFILKSMPHYAGVTAKEIYKKVHFESFNSDKNQPFIKIFDYGKQPNPVTGLYNNISTQL